MQVRMIPVEAVFLRFPRLVRDLSSKLGKQVELVLTGQDTELDRTVVDALGDPLVHLVRNSLDHGLEPPDERARRRQAARPARSRSPPATPAATSSSPSATTAAASIPRGSPRKARRARPDRPPTRSPRSTWPRAVELLFAARLLDRRARPATSPAAASAWTPCAARSASSAARSPMTSELGGGTTVADPPAADARDHAGAARRGRRHAVRDPARPRRAHAATSPTRPCARSTGQRDAGARATACCRCSTLGAALGYPAAGAGRLRRHRPRRRARLALAVDAAGRPARAGHPAAARRGRRRDSRSPAAPCSPTATIALIVDCDALAGQPGPRRPPLPTRPTPPRSVEWNCTDIQLDALREIANIGSGNAATALSGMLGRAGRPVGAAARSRCRWPTRSTPSARPRTSVTAVVIAGRRRARGASCCCSSSPTQRATRCAACSASSRTTRRWRCSALGEIGNILGSSYIGALGIDDRPRDRAAAAAGASTDMLGAIVAIVAGAAAADSRHGAAARLELHGRGRRVRVRRSCSSPAPTASSSCWPARPLGGEEGVAA